MAAALATTTTAPASPDDAWRVSHDPPRIDLAPFTRAELDEWFRGGEPVADDCEKLLVWSARAAGGIDLAIAEGLHALRQGDRLAQLGCHLDDYAREVLDIGRRTAENLVRLGGALRTRPLLREALRCGRLGIRAAETVLPVAVGAAEVLWVDRAESQTVRELEDAVRRSRGSPEDAEDEWLRLRTHLPPDERSVVDAGLELARELMPGSSRVEGLEALAQEYLAEFSTDGDADETRPLGPGFRASALGRDSRRAALEVETERWAALPEVAAIAAPDVRFYETATAQDIDCRLRKLARVRAGWDDVIGYCAHVVRRSGMHTLLGFASFRQYVEERLQLPARTVEQREALEKRLWESPALQEARRQGLSYEKLRVLSRLPEPEIGSWIPRAHATTCIALKRAVDGERERQMRAARKLVVPLPRRVAVLLAAAVQAVRERFGRVLSTGTCLAVIAFHFIETWSGVGKRSRSRSRKVRERDEGWCQVPGCSHRAAHSHHVLFRSHGGGDDLENQVALCAFHHLRCVHGGHLAVFGRAPDGLTWLLGGTVWTGPSRRSDQSEPRGSKRASRVTGGASRRRAARSA
jgi:hypothetical protein